MFQFYLPAVLFLCVGALIGGVAIFFGYLFSRSEPTQEKLAPYECGFENFGDARGRFDMRYYLIAILFVLFDLEIAFLFPWALVFKDMGWYGLLTMVVFVLEFLVGYVYIWRRGALEWE